MSIQLPIMTCTDKQLFTNTDGDHYELRLHNGALYIFRKHNGSYEGGFIALDSLPISILYGDYGGEQEGIDLDSVEWAHH